MERTPDKEVENAHEENRQSESESRRQDMTPPRAPDTEQKHNGTTSAYSAATGGNTGNDTDSDN